MILIYQHGLLTSREWLLKLIDQKNEANYGASCLENKEIDDKEYVLGQQLLGNYKVKTTNAT